MEMTKSTSAVDIDDVKYVEMVLYVGEQPKFRDIVGSGESTNGARAISSDQSQMRRGDRDVASDEAGGTQNVEKACGQKGTRADELQSSDGTRPIILHGWDL